MIGMVGSIVMIVILVVAIPVAVLVTGGIGAAILGGSVNATNDADNEGTELFDLTYPDSKK